MRTCSSCAESKPEGEFYGRTGRPSYECKACHSARKKRERLARKVAGVHAPRGTCTSCGKTKDATEFRKNWAFKSGLERHCRDCVSHGNRKRLFDLTPEEYAAKLAEQGGVCAICGKPEKTRANNGLMVKSLAVDHNHATGQIRGLLCANCNKGIGNLGEDVDRLIAAARYLLEYSDASMREGSEPPVGDLEDLSKGEVI